MLAEPLEVAPGRLVLGEDQETSAVPLARRTRPGRREARTHVLVDPCEQFPDPLVGQAAPSVGDLFQAVDEGELGAKSLRALTT
jgi:hypothetical protein